MQNKLRLDILPQPDETTCGPTCLHAVYKFFGDDLELPNVISEIGRLENGGTLSAMLGVHALKRGYSTTLYTYNLNMFDPTWFAAGMGEVRGKLAEQVQHKQKRRLLAATDGYLEYLDLGGRLAFEDLTRALITRYLSRGVPILTGLSATYLYRAPREFGPQCNADDVRGYPAGHFVVLTGIDAATEKVQIADPLTPNPLFNTPLYEVDIDRVICSILLGILTYDDTLLVIEPRNRDERGSLKGAPPEPQAKG